MIQIKRVYEPHTPGDGKRFLVDRLWPRGIRKDKLKYDSWLREIAPSTELRKWFTHDPSKWRDFQKRYRAELKQHTDDLKVLIRAAREGNVTLLYGAKDEEHNNAVVLKEVLKKKA